MFTLVRASFTISPSGNTLQQCNPTDLIWTEEPPIHLWAAPNQDDTAGDAILHDFGIINTTFLLWTVDLPIDQNVSFTYVRTAVPTLLYSSPQAYSVVAGSDSCLDTDTNTDDGSSVESSTKSGSAPSEVYSMHTSGGQFSGTAGGVITTNSGNFATPTMMSSTSSITTSPISSVGPIANGSQQSSSSKAYIGGIVGGVAAAVVVVVGVVMFFVNRRRRRLSMGPRLLASDLLDEELTGSAESLQGTRMSEHANVVMSPSLIVTPFPFESQESRRTCSSTNFSLAPYNVPYVDEQEIDHSKTDSAMQSAAQASDTGISYEDDGEPHS